MNFARPVAITAAAFRRLLAYFGIGDEAESSAPRRRRRGSAPVFRPTSIDPRKVRRRIRRMKSDPLYLRDVEVETNPMRLKGTFWVGVPTAKRRRRPCPNDLARRWRTDPDFRRERAC